MRCPSCRNKLIKHDGATAVLRTKGAVSFGPEGAATRCFWCSEPVTLPLRVSMTDRPVLLLRKARAARN